MVRGRKGQIFSAYLVLLTLFLCFVSVAFYLIQQGNVENSLVSPKIVLEIQKNYSEFEILEKKVIQNALVKSRAETNDLSEDSFLEYSFLLKFKNNFIEEVNLNEGMKEFLFSDLVLEGIESPRESLIENEIIQNYFYRDFVTESENILLKRNLLHKRLQLVAEDKNKINFQTTFNYETERKYLISFDGSEFRIE